MRMQENIWRICGSAAGKSMRETACTGEGLMSPVFFVASLRPFTPSPVMLRPFDQRKETGCSRDMKFTRLLSAVSRLQFFRQPRCCGALHASNAQLPVRSTCEPQTPFQHMNQPRNTSQPGMPVYASHQEPAEHTNVHVEVSGVKSVPVSAYHMSSVERRGDGVKVREKIQPRNRGCQSNRPSNRDKPRQYLVVAVVKCRSNVRMLQSIREDRLWREP